MVEIRQTLPRALLPLLYTLAVALLWLASAGRPFYFTLDDSYITLHNARALWAGGDANFGVSPLVGATSLVHLLLVAALLPVLGPVGADVAVGLGATLLYLWGVERLAFRHSLSLRAAAALLLVAAGSASMLFHLTNGLETALALAGVTWAILLADRPAPSRVLAILCGLLPFLRPELALLSAALLLRQAWRRRAEHRPAQAIAIDLALALLAAAPFVLWSWLQTGAVLPNTAGAKVAWFADAQRPLAWKLKTAAQALALGLGLPLAALPFARRGSLALALAAFALAFVGASLWVYASGLSAYQGRYVAVLLPACLWALCAWSASLRVRAVLLWACAFVALFGLVHAETLMQALAWRTGNNAGTIAWAERNLPHDQVVLVHDAGMSAYASTLKLCDVVGLKTPAAIPIHQALTARREADRGAAIARIAAHCRGRFAIVHHVPFWSDLVGALDRASWRPRLLHRSGDPGGYDVYALTPPP